MNSANFLLRDFPRARRCSPALNSAASPWSPPRRLDTGLPCIFIRNAKKDYGTAKQLEGSSLHKATASSSSKTSPPPAARPSKPRRSYRELGADVLAVIATIDRQEGARENIEAAGIAFEALFTVADLGIDPTRP